MTNPQTTPGCAVCGEVHGCSHSADEYAGRAQTPPVREGLIGLAIAFVSFIIIFSMGYNIKNNTAIAEAADWKKSYAAEKQAHDDYVAKVEPELDKAGKMWAKGCRP